MTRRRWIIGGVVAALALAAVLAGGRGQRGPWYEAVTAQRGEVRSLLHEAGELAPRDPLLVKVPFNGRVSFVIEDGAWVEQGATLLVIGEDDEVKRLTDDRGQLVGAQQELRLAMLRREQADGAEAQKVTAALRALELEKLRWRILTEPAVGGTELARLSDELAPLDEATRAARETWEQSQQAWQRALGAYLDAVDRHQDRRDTLLRAQSRVDELAAVAEASAEGLQAAELAEREKAASELPAAREELAKARAGGAEVAKAVADARAARDAAAGPRDLAAQALAEREALERELRVRIEIEKRGLELTLLRLDEQGAALALAEAERKRDEGRAAAASGALSQATLDELETAAATSANQLEIVRQKIAIAARPVAPEALEEAKAKLERAQARAERAEAARSRALAILDQEGGVLRARIARLEHGIAARCERFPALLEDTIRFAERELEALADGDDAARRTELERQLPRLRERLEQAKADPPNTLKAPAAGICRVRREGDRSKQAGDPIYEHDVIVELFPPTHMEVLLRVNEANVARLSPGMPAVVEIPSLPGEPLPGVVERVAGVGKDKSATEPGRPFADVTQFETRVRLERTSEEFRQGMSALVTVELGRRSDALWLPLGAVTRAGDGWQVLVGDADSPTPRRIEGEPFGADAFLVASGVEAGETVYIHRPGDG